MIPRLRAELVFTKASGFAAWALANMQVRFLQAEHIREGTPWEEAPVNEYEDFDDLHHIYRCDLPLMNPAHAADAYNTLTVISAFIIEGFVEEHQCFHDEVPVLPCVSVRKWVK